MATKRRGGKKGVISVDFTGVEAGGGGGRLLPEDTYQFELVELTEEEGQESGEPYLAGVFEVAEGDFKGTKAWDNFSLQPQALWKLRSFLESSGFETEDGPMDLDPDELIGLVGTADIIHEEYRGKTKHRVNSWLVEKEDTGGKEKSSGARKRDDGGARRKSNGKDEDNGGTDWKVRDEVTFKEGKKTLQGRITSIEDGEVTVKVGRDEYVMSVDDISAP